MTDLAETDIQGSIAELQIGEFGPPALDAIASQLRAIAETPNIHVVVLSAPENGFQTLSTGDTDVASIIELLPQPVIACIEGGSAGCGFAVALACDLRIASHSATFSFAEIAGGVLPPMGAMQRLPRLIGRGRAAQLILSGETFDAEAALACGLVNEVREDGRTSERGRELAARIAAQGPIAVRYAKEAIRQGLDMPLDQALRYETDLTVILQTTGDRAEGVRAFLEKRPPSFKGS